MKCDFCGENEGTKLINNPNYDTDDLWKVCKGCKKHIEETQQKAMNAFMKPLYEELEKKKRERNKVKWRTEKLLKGDD